MKKKIIFTVTNDLTYDQRMIRICGTLADNGYEVLLVGRKRKHAAPLVKRTFEQYRLNCVFDTGKLFYLEYSIRLFFFLLFSKADIHSAADTDTLLPNTLVSKIRSRKLVYDAHEYFTEVPEVTGRRFVKSLWTRIELICVPHAHLCYTVSQSLCRVFTDLFRKEFFLIRNVPQASSNTHTPDTSRSNKPFTIIYQGDLNPGRGIEEAIEAMKELEAEFIIAGDGPLRQELELRIAKASLQSKVKLTGYLPREKLAEVTAQADLGLNVLANLGLSYYYSLSNKFFNYIHAGIPQICADFPEYRLINHEHEVAVLTSLSAEHIRTCIRSLMNDQILYARLKANCRKAAETYTWENEQTLLLKLYHEL